MSENKRPEKIPINSTNTNHESKTNSLPIFKPNASSSSSVKIRKSSNIFTSLVRKARRKKTPNKSANEEIKNLHISSQNLSCASTISLGVHVEEVEISCQKYEKKCSQNQEMYWEERGMCSETNTSNHSLASSTKNSAKVVDLPRVHNLKDNTKEQTNINQNHTTENKEVAIGENIEDCEDHATSSFVTLPKPTLNVALADGLQYIQETVQSLHDSENYIVSLLNKYIRDPNIQKHMSISIHIGYGKDFIKSCNVSPDVYIQLAYYKLYGKFTATYESASTRRFLLGRVDCIRSASPEALEWATAMSQPKEETDYDIGNKKVTFHLVSDDRKLALWNEAVRAQTKEMVDNILGQGIDIHLLGLREAARETSPTAPSPLPELFTDSSYSVANKFLLSTSQVATGMNSFMGYGPVEVDGYGASYNPKKDHIIFCLSAFWSSEITSTSKFAQSLEESLTVIQGLLARPNGN